MPEKISAFNLAYKLTRADSNDNYYRHLSITLVDRRYNDEPLVHLKWQSDSDRLDKDEDSYWYGGRFELPHQSTSRIDNLTLVARLLRHIIPKEWHGDRSLSYLDPYDVIQQLKKRKAPRVFHDPRVGYAIEIHELAPATWFTYQANDPMPGYRVVAESEAKGKIAMINKSARILDGKEAGYMYQSKYEEWINLGMPLEHCFELDHKAPKIKNVGEMLDIHDKLEVYG